MSLLNFLLGVNGKVFSCRNLLTFANAVIRVRLQPPTRAHARFTTGKKRRRWGSWGRFLFPLRTIVQSIDGVALDKDGTPGLRCKFSIMNDLRDTSTFTPKQVKIIEADVIHGKLCEALPKGQAKQVKKAFVKNLRDHRLNQAMVKEIAKRLGYDQAAARLRHALARGDASGRRDSARITGAGFTRPGPPAAHPLRGRALSQKLASARAACSREGIMSQMPDITITYQAGDSPPFLKANTGRGRLWLAQNIKGVRVTNTAMASPEELLSLIAKMTEVSAAWKK